MAQSQDVLTVAQSFFASVTAENFSHLFRFSVVQVTQLCFNDDRPQFVRNILMTLLQLKHYLPVRSVCILFGLAKSRFDELFKSTLNHIISTFGNRISLSNRAQDNSLPEFPSTYTVIDCTECVTWTYGPHENGKDAGYSGKKKMFTVKYQVVVGALDGVIYDIYGPEYGSTHDVTIYLKSGFRTFLNNNHEYCLGDRGYQGCSDIFSPLKAHGNQFTQQEKLYNKDVGKYRQIVERVFGSLKKWTILRSPYRGTMTEHYYIFVACCILTTF